MPRRNMTDKEKANIGKKMKEYWAKRRADRAAKEQRAAKEWGSLLKKDNGHSQTHASNGGPAEIAVEIDGRLLRCREEGTVTLRRYVPAVD